jgi:cytosine/uracil/thiamine/allantoin permease
VNPVAIGAMLAGVGVCLLGKVHPALEFLFNGAWFSGTLTSLAVYVVLMRGKVPAPPAGARGPA